MRVPRLLSFLWILCLPTPSLAFSFPSCSFSSRLSSRLFYRDDKTSRNNHQNNILTIPVLGPIPNQLPLLPGQDLVLHAPTPGQWSALQQALTMHHQQTDHGGSTIHAAPVIAVLDQYTSATSGLRYATIAAVVGVSKQQLDNTRQTTTTRLDTQQDFMESLQQSSRAPLISESNIRLVGIGRAMLHDFFYASPVGVDEEGHLILHEEQDDDDDDSDYEGSSTLPHATNDNIIMAQFDFILDGLGKTSNGRKATTPSSYASPVHAIAEMSQMASKIQYLHQERKRLVAGIKAAEARLRAAEEEWMDHDGIGQLFVEPDTPQGLDLLEGIVGGRDDSSSLANQPFSETATTTRSEPPPQQRRLTRNENYGMDYTASWSTIRDLTRVWLEKLAPYYSPKRQDSEEHYYEILSFVAILAMDRYLEPHELAWVVMCRNTVERLEQAREWMQGHVRLLQDESVVLSTKLRECGEECTDLW